MRKVQLLMSRLFAVCIAVLAGASTPATASEFRTPEEAIASYVGGVAQRDLAQVLDATAIEEMRDGFDFVAYVERLRALVPSMPAPADDPFFADLNAAQFTAAIAGQVKFLTYGLLTTSKVIEAKTVQMDAEGAAGFVAELDATRLSRLTIEAIRMPSPTLMASERYVANAGKQALVYGADESTERVVLLRFEGLHYGIGFTLLRFGESWKISNQSSPIAGTSNLGAPAPTTPEAFMQATQ